MMENDQEDVGLSSWQATAALFAISAFGVMLIMSLGMFVGWWVWAPK